MSVSDLAPLPPGHSALRRIVRLAARALDTHAAQFLSAEGAGTDGVHGSPVDLRSLGLDALVTDEHGLVVTDTVGTPPFARLAPDVRFLAAVPVLGGQRQRLGILCVIDSEPRTLDTAEQQTLAEFGCLAAEVAEARPAAVSAARDLFGDHRVLMLMLSPESGRVVEANAAAAAFYGRPAEEIVGGSLAALCLLPEDRVLPALHRALQDPRPVLRLRHRIDEGVRTVEFQLSPVEAGGRLLLHAVGHDVTEAVRAVERLRGEVRDLRSAFDRAPVMVGIAALTDGDFVHVAANEAVARFFETTVEAAESRPASALGFPPDLLARWAEAFRQSALGGGEVRFAYDHPHARGVRRLDVSVRCVGVAGDGVPRFAYVAEDITVRDETEAAVQSEGSRAEFGDRLRSDLLASLDHEIRTPLAELVGFSEALDAAVADEHRDVSGLVVRHGHRLLGTIDSVLDLARLETGDGITPGLVDVGAEVEAAAAVLQALAERKGLSFDLWVAPTPPAFADAVLLGRVVTNLVGNALAFTEEGGVAVEVAADDEAVVLRVRDTSASVNAAFLPTNAASPAGGDGVLTVTQRLVDLLGGTLETTNRTGEGTTFTVRLPLATAASSGVGDAVAGGASAEI